MENCIKDIKPLHEPQSDFSNYGKCVGYVFFFLILSWFGSFYFLKDYFYGLIAIASIYIVIAVLLWLYMKWKYKQFVMKFKGVRTIVTNILRQGINHGSVDVHQICANCDISYEIFKTNFIHTLECPRMEEIGVLDLAEGIFYSKVWEGAQQSNQEDLDAIIREFETLHIFNLTQFAVKFQADMDAMKALLFRFCGETIFPPGRKPMVMETTL